MIIHNVEDVRFTLAEGTWIDKGPRRGEFSPLKIRWPAWLLP